MPNLSVVLKAISSESRLEIFRLLKKRSFCVNAIVHRLGMKQAAVSQHLRILKEAGLVEAQKCGYWVHYSVNWKALARWRAAVDKLLSEE